MKMCSSCGEDEVLWLDTTSGDPEPEEQHLCLDCYDKYPWHGRCQLCGVWGWVNSDEKCWGCTCNELDCEDKETCDCSQCQEVAEETERVRCQVCQFWYWEEELVEGLCELCQEAEEAEDYFDACDDCERPLDDEGYCLRCDNVGFCGRCQNYGPRVANWQAGAICLDCNKLVEL